MSSSSGVIVVVRPGCILPEDYQKILLDKHTSFSWSIANDKEKGAGCASLFFSGTPDPLNLDKDKQGRKFDLAHALKEAVNKFEKKQLVLRFNNLETELIDGLHRQPFPLIEDNGKTLVHGFCEGDFLKYSQDEEYSAEAAFMYRYFMDEINSLYEGQCEKSLEKLFAHFATKDFKTSQFEHLEPRGVVYLRDHNDRVSTIVRGDKEFMQYDWGITSNSLGYVEAPKEEKPEPVAAKAMTYAEKLAAKRSGASAPAVEVKEPKTEEPLKEVKSPAETPILDPKFGVLDGDKVRPPVTLHDRPLKDWYSSHRTDKRCPQNYKERPAIFLSELAKDSHIKRIVEGTHRVPVKSDDKPIAASTGNGTSHSILTPDQIKDAVTMDKTSTIIVDPAQFTAAEKEYPSFCERTGIPLDRLVRYGMESLELLCAGGSGPAVIHELRMALIKANPELMKTIPADTKTSDKPTEKEEAPKQSYAEKLAARRAGKAA